MIISIWLVLFEFFIISINISITEIEPIELHMSNIMIFSKYFVTKIPSEYNQLKKDINSVKIFNTN